MLETVSKGPQRPLTSVKFLHCLFFPGPVRLSAERQSSAHQSPEEERRPEPQTSDASFCLPWDHRRSEWASAVTTEILACGPGWLRRLHTPPPRPAPAQLTVRSKQKRRSQKSLRTETEAAWLGAFWELQFTCLGLLHPQAKRSGSVARVATDAGRQAGAWFPIRSLRPEALLSHPHFDREQRPLGVGAWRGAGPQVSQKRRSPRAPARLLKSRGGKGRNVKCLKDLNGPRVSWLWQQPWCSGPDFSLGTAACNP